MFTYMQSGTDTSDDGLWFVYPDDPQLPDGDMGPYEDYYKAEDALKAWEDFLTTNPTLEQKKEYIRQNRSTFDFINYQDNPEKRIERYIQEFVHSNYGSSEAADPCYNLAELASYLQEKLYGPDNPIPK